MGLDMFLHRKSWVDSSEWVKPEYRTEIKITTGGKEVDTSKIRFIVEEVGYWRKANAIHKWFVDNVQNGKDDCGEYSVTHEQLERLKSICEAVLKDLEKGEVALAESELPTQTGFFFGDTDYGQYYKEDLKDTVKIIDGILKHGAGEITYSSSW